MTTLPGKRLYSLLSAATVIVKLAAPPRWAIYSVTGLGLLGATFEAVGLFLFIPLIESLGVAENNGNNTGGWILRSILLSAKPENSTAILIAILCAIICIKNAALLASVYVTRYIDGSVAHHLRLKIFNQTISSCIDYRADHQRTDIISTITNNSWKVSQGLSLVYRAIISSCTVVVFIFFLLAISVGLTLISAGFLSVSVLINHFITKRANHLGKEVVEENNRFGLRMWESINSLPLIRAFGQENFEASRFASASDRVRQRILKLDLLWATPTPISEIAVMLLIGTIILIGTSSKINFAAIAAFLTLLYRMQSPIRELMQVAVGLDSLMPAVNDVGDFLRATQTPFLTSGSVIAKPICSSIEFRNVSFRYASGDAWALRDVSFAIPAGKTTAIIGESGAGKSTIIALLLRLYDPTEGCIQADDTPLYQYDLSSWRRQLALMSQEIYMFNDTVRANVAYGDLNASSEDILTAIQIARASDFVGVLPSGLETRIGDQGMRLSGGQRQRIALARTILRNPNILILDEATNALDVETEYAFQAALREYSKFRTVVLIAHRLSTVQNVDQIIVINEGKVIESGPPQVLLAKPSQFARLYHLQDGRPAASTEA